MIEGDIAITRFSKEDARKNKRTKIFEINAYQPVYKAAIIHPSLGSPLLVEDKHKNEISIFLAAGQDFSVTFAKKSSGGARSVIGRTILYDNRNYPVAFGGTDGGNPIKNVICDMLHIIPWDRVGTVLKNPKNAGSQARYPDRESAMEKISCTLLGDLRIEIKDADGRHFANIRNGTFRALQKEGLTRLYQITLRDHPALQSTGLFEVFWSYRRMKHDVADAHPHPKLENLSDKLVRDLVRTSFYNPEGNGDPGKAVKPGPDKAYVVTDTTIDFSAFDDKVPLMMRHPIYISAKDSLNIAHIGDLHISSRQHAYKQSRATVIPGVDSEISRPIGELASNNLENSLELMNRIGGEEKDIDLLIVAGDLYDHLHNFDPTTLKGSTTGKLWEAMYLTDKDDVRARIEEYPYGIDALAFYSMLLHYYNTCQKPVLMLSGNHEAYRYPYGISPRVPIMERANDGIPLDHNLTFYEAILMYGPGYSATIPPAAVQGYGGWWNDRNFQMENFAWFFTAFSPLADCVTTFGDQCLVCLEWGDDESYIASTAKGGGTLPRAGKGGGAQQIALGNAALDLPQANKILCTHFTLVNYDPDIALSEKGQVGVADKYTLHEYGSGWGTRETLYGDWLRDSRFRYTLAGHAHRVAMYACTPDTTWDNINNSSLRRVPCLATQGYFPTTEVQANWGDATKVIVSSSAGCMAKQNHQGEMSGKGMDRPAATLLYFNGREHIEIMPSQRPTAKPRFCVACDYIDILDGGFWEYFKAVDDQGTFLMKPYWQKIHPKLAERAKGKMIESVTLYLVGDGVTSTIESKKLKSHEDGPLFGDAVRWEFGTNLSSRIEFHGASLGAMFLSIKFNAEAFTGLTGFTHYDFDSPWNIQVGLYSGSLDLLKKPEDNILPGCENDPITRHLVEAERKLLERKRAEMGSWQIMRHKKDGEVPSFIARVGFNSFEYDNDLDMPK